MIWVAVFGGLALAGFVALAAYVAVPIRQKIDSLRNEVIVLGERAVQFGALVRQVDLDSLRRH